MKITNVKLRLVSGSMPTTGEFWEERLIRPIDIYPEHKAERAGAGIRDDGNATVYPHSAVFIEIETDEGITGLGGPIPREIAYIVDHDFRGLLIGADPIATERIWDQLYRQAIHGRKGNAMLAISAIDCTLWDLRGKVANMPVYQLLGGPVRTEFPAYASMLGYSIAPGKAGERAREAVAQGYTAMKWFFRDGPTDGRAGIARNVALVKELREAVGPDVEIMLDAWSSWDVPYTVQMSERLAEYAPRWIEEPVLADKIDACAEIRRRSKVPIATGEHEYTRWGIKQLLDAGAADVIQADIYWAGGISETLKIAALCSAYDIPLIPHGHSTLTNAHFIAAQTPVLCPILEYLIKWNEIHQYFLLHPLTPVNGTITMPARPGMGLELDPAKIEAEDELRW
jgi:L-alanine-DL-glutamate epimerase-like enolase superfamily enzyme